jgi:hypothetical protein
MVKDQHPQATKEASGNVLPTWLDAFKVLLDLDPQQDISGEHWDGLEIRIQIFRVRTAFSFLFCGRYVDLAGKDRPSIRYTHRFRASSRRIYQLMLRLLCTTSTCSTRPTCGTISLIACQSQIRLKASRSSFTSLSHHSSTL